MSSLKSKTNQILLELRSGLVLYLCYGLYGRPVLQQKLHHFYSVLLASNVKWSEAVLDGETINTTVTSS